MAAKGSPGNELAATGEGRPPRFVVVLIALTSRGAVGGSG
jgi:hypothetical protein